MEEITITVAVRRQLVVPLRLPPVQRRVPIPVLAEAAEVLLLRLHGQRLQEVPERLQAVLLLQEVPERLQVVLRLQEATIRQVVRLLPEVTIRLHALHRLPVLAAAGLPDAAVLLAEQEDDR